MRKRALVTFIGNYEARTSSYLKTITKKTIQQNIKLRLTIFRTDFHTKKRKCYDEKERKKNLRPILQSR